MALKQKYKTAIVTTALALLAGCTAVNTSQPTNALMGRVDSSVKADVTVGEKIHGETTSKILSGFIKWAKTTTMQMALTTVHRMPVTG